MRKPSKLTGLDRFMLRIAPQWTMRRIRTRDQVASFARYYEASQPGRRNSSWRRVATDANQANRQGIAILREYARDLVRNNGTAENGLRVIARNTIGWGIQAKVIGPAAETAQNVWNSWARATTCDVDGRYNFDGIQAEVIKAMALSGEVIIRRRTASLNDGLPVPIQIQVLESDYLDHLRDGPLVDDYGVRTGKMIQGVEFDTLGRRVAYWLFEQHPGGERSFTSLVSKRVPADQVLHIFRVDRPGQVRGITWFASSIFKLKDSDAYEDAALVSAKVAACFTAFVTDPNGDVNPLGPNDTEADEDAEITDSLEPGMIYHLKPGQEVSFGTPPIPQDREMTKAYERRIARGLGITYEELTGDYSEVNYSSARMSRIGHRANVEDWRWQIIVPQLCDAVFKWVMFAATLAKQVPEIPSVTWTAPPLPMVEPDKEALALMRLVRAGAMTPDEMIRQMGEDPDRHWEAYSANIKRLRELGITLDVDAGLTTQNGQAQALPPKDPTSQDVKALPTGGGDDDADSEDPSDEPDEDDTGLAA
jgi:lambda family phage portal protein